jgi:hypothetical protein
MGSRIPRSQNRDLGHPDCGARRRGTQTTAEIGYDFSNQKLRNLDAGGLSDLPLKGCGLD